MNFSQMHERLRLELLRRIRRGTLSVSLLARQTGFGQSHLSLFLNARRQLSMEGVDRVLAAQHLTAADLLPSRASPQVPAGEDLLDIPLVSHATAMYEPYVRPGAVQSLIPIPAGVLARSRLRGPSSRLTWARFVVIQAGPVDGAAMNPVVVSDALVLLDRHYSWLYPYYSDRPTLYAVRHGTRLKIRYADYQAGQVLLRPYNRVAPVELIDPGPGEAPRDLITGRVVLVMNET